MNLQDALAAIRDLEALPLPRRRHLAILVADAPSDADRARLVLEARHENRRVRQQAEAALKAQYVERAALADYTVEHAAEEPERPAGVRRWEGDGITYPEPRPVTISWTTPTKTATPQQTRERRRLTEPVRHHHGSSPGRNETPVPKAKPESKPKVLPEHGTISRYTNQKCRCTDCRAAKSAANRREREVRAARRAELAAVRSAQSPE